MIIKPESLGFKIEDNDLIEVFLYNPDVPAWSGVVIDPGNEWRDNGVYSFEAIGYASRAKGFLVNRTFSGDTISAMAAAVGSDIAGKDSRLFFDASLIDAVPQVVSSYKIDYRAGLETMQKLADMAGNIRFSILGDRFIRFQARNTAYSQGCIFHADSKKVKINKIERSKTDRLKNIYVLERKSASGAGSARVVSNSGSPSDPAYALNGVIRVEDSIAQYGEYMSRESLPETANDTDAIRYGVQKAILTAFPKYKIELSVNFDYLNELKIADGKGIVFNREELFIDTIENCEVAGRWAVSGGFSLAESTFRYEGKKSIQFTGSVSAGEYAVCFPLETQDFSQVRQVSFWVYSANAGNVFNFCYGESVFDENEIPVNITEPNSWQLVKIMVNADYDIDRFGIKFSSAGTVNFYLDNVQKQYLGRRRYDLEIKRVEYEFRANEQKINFELGSNEKPFVDIFVDAWRSIEAQKAAGSGGT
jgi:hypothetical protein